MIQNVFPWNVRIKRAENQGARDESRRGDGGMRDINACDVEEIRDAHKIDMRHYAREINVGCFHDACTRREPLYAHLMHAQ